MTTNIKTVLSVALAAILFSCCTDSHRVFDNPATIADNTTDNLHSLKVEKVEFTDTATVLSFKYTASKRGYRLCISSGSVLSDEKGRTYKAKFFKEKPFDKKIKSTPEGMTLTVGFEPMPRNVRIFDYIGGVQFEDPRIFGISESPCKIKAPSYSGKEKKQLEQYREGFFRKGTVSIQGKIEGYGSSSGYSSLSLIYDDYSEGTQTMMMVPVSHDGRFERSLDILHPKSSYMELEGEKDNRSIYWYVEPGDTLNITVKQDGTEEYALSDGRPYKLEHYSGCGLTGFSLYPFSEFMADGESLSQEEISAKITEKTALGQKLVDYLARKNNFSAYEYSYASYLVQSDLLTCLMDYRMNEKERPLNELLAHKISYGQYDSLRRAVAVRQSDPEQLAPLREFKGANDIMFLSLPGVWPVFNRYKFDSAFTYGKNSIPRLNPCCLSVDSLLMENDKRIFKSDEPSLLGKLCLLQDLRMHLKQELEKNDSTGNEVCAKYLEGFKALINNPNMAVKADWIAQDQAEKMKPYKELPDCKGKEVLDRILANYPGKYVFLDFWAVGCGPCRAGIESCRKLRPDLMGNNYDSLVLVFITDDREDVYTPYYEANLKGAESYRISHDDYLALCDMFKFSGIPHHEYITPDGKACTNVPEMTSLDPKKPE